MQKRTILTAMFAVSILGIALQVRAADEPKPATETPKTDAPKAETPKTDAPKPEAAKEAVKEEKKTVTSSGLTIIEVAPGEAGAKAGDIVWVHYTGTLKDGTEFDSSRKRNEPIRFRLGKSEVIKGWDEGVAGMKVGEKRKLVIPSTLGYGEKGSPPTIPGGAELHFDVELVGMARVAE